MNIRRLFIIQAAACLLCTQLSAQPAVRVGVNAMAHSHNDYERDVPFYKAYSLGFASIEADIFVENGSIYVAHTYKEINRSRTLGRMYIEPVISMIELNGGTVYPDPNRKLQLYIDLKTDYTESMPVLTALLEPHRHYFDARHNPDAVRIVLCGRIPPPEEFDRYDGMFLFDGLRGVSYTPAQFQRVAFFNQRFTGLSKWNGEGRMTAVDFKAVRDFIDSVHLAGKPVRFWDTPDTPTAYQAFIKLGLDYINTDNPEKLAAFLNGYDRRLAVSDVRQPVCTPTYETDSKSDVPRNIILLIASGAGLNHLWAAASVNVGSLNVMRFRNIGIANTSAADNYIPDAAASATALATGVRTNNRRVGTDSQGKKAENLIETLSRKGMVSAVVTNDETCAATPAGFYAHQPDRSYIGSITKDLLESPLFMLLGAYPPALDQHPTLIKRLADKYDICYSTGTMPSRIKRPVLCMAGRFDGEVPPLSELFDVGLKTVSERSKEKGFLLVAEEASTETASQSGDMERMVAGYLDFDRTVGKALEFADADGSTLVIVVADHETGGLSLYDGGYARQTVLGGFSTPDNTGVCVPVLAYGPRSYYFRGFMRSTDVHRKITQLLDLNK